MAEKIEITQAIHRQIGVSLFNRVWDLMEKNDRSQEETDEMIHAVHASRHHWQFAGGTAVNLARGEWQISRVYSVLKRSEPALYHGKRCLEICEENQIGDFDLAFAYEALARGYALAGDKTLKEKYKNLAVQSGKDIKEEADKNILTADLDSIP